MGVEMTLLRALAFHPRMPLPEPEVPRQSFAPVAPTAVMTPTRAAATAISAAARHRLYRFPETTSQWLAARQQLQRACRSNQSKKSGTGSRYRARPVNNAALERLASVTDRVQARLVPSALEKSASQKEAYRWKATTPVMQQKKWSPRRRRWNAEHEKRRNWRRSWRQEAIERDAWAARGESTFATKTGRTGGLKCLRKRRATTQYVCICAPLSGI